MKKFILLFFLLMIGFVSAVPLTEVSYFYSVSCSHCQIVADSGILENVSGIEGVSLTKYEVTSPVNRERYLDYAKKLGVEAGEIPFLVIKQGGEFSYLMGDGPIIENLKDVIINFKKSEVGSQKSEVKKKLSSLCENHCVICG